MNEAFLKNWPVPNPALTYGALWDRYHVEMDHSPISLVFHLHVPKAGGNSMRTLFSNAGFHIHDFDMTISSFFGPRLSREEWLSNGVFEHRLMTGHFRLDASILRECPFRHTIVTLLRDPLDRLLSHYNHALRIPGSPWHEQLLAGDMTFLQYAETFLQPGSVGPQYSFFDDTGSGTFAWSGKSDAVECFENLKTKVGQYGILDRYRLGRFLQATGMLLGLALQEQPPEENSTAALGDISIPIKAETTVAERKVLEDLFRDDILFFRLAVAEWDGRHAL